MDIIGGYGEARVSPFRGGYLLLQPEKSCSQPDNFLGSRQLLFISLIVPKKLSKSWQFITLATVTVGKVSSLQPLNVFMYFDSFKKTFLQAYTNTPNGLTSSNVNIMFRVIRIIFRFHKKLHSQQCNPTINAGFFHSFLNPKCPNETVFGASRYFSRLKLPRGSMH